MIQTLSKLHEGLFWKKYESASDRLHAAVYTFTVAGISHIKLYAHCADRRKVCSLACNKLEDLGRKL
jgi:hypothetical protein